MCPDLVFVGPCSLTIVFSCRAEWHVALRDDIQKLPDIFPEPGLRSTHILSPRLGAQPTFLLPCYQLTLLPLYINRLAHLTMPSLIDFADVHCRQLSLTMLHTTAKLHRTRTAAIAFPATSAGTWSTSISQCFSMVSPDQMLPTIFV